MRTSQRANFLLCLLALFASGCKPLERLPPGWDGDVWLLTDAGSDSVDSGEPSDAVDAAVADALCGQTGCATAKLQGCLFVCDGAAASAWSCLANACGSQLQLCVADSTCLAVLNGVFACALACDTAVCRQACAQTAPLPVSLPGCGWNVCWPNMPNP